MVHFLAFAFFLIDQFYINLGLQINTYMFEEYKWQYKTTKHRKLGSLDSFSNNVWSL